MADWQGVRAGLFAVASALCLGGLARGQCERWLTAQGPGAHENDRFGHAVAVSGSTAVVGAPYDRGAGFISGAAWVLQRGDPDWEVVHELRPADNAEGDLFGTAVGIDGPRIVAGAPHDDDGGDQSGSAYVFAWSGDAWVEEAKLTASDAAPENEFGGAVEISGDTIVVGASQDDGWTGAVYVFVRVGATWIEESKLFASDPTGADLFGTSIDLSADGQTLLIGAPYADHAGFNNPGAAYVFERDPAGWQERHRLEAHDPWHGAYFGFSVALDADRIVAGAPDWQSIAWEGCGSAYVFEWDGSAWGETDKLVPPDALLGDQVGMSVALRGSRLAFSSRDIPGGAEPGAVYLFELGPTGWVQGTQLTTELGGCLEGFGTSVALGSHVLIGAAGYSPSCPGTLFTYDAACIFGFWPYGDCSVGAPCGNGEVTGGCANSTGAGATLQATSPGTNSVTSDDLVLRLGQVPANQSALIYMGTERDLVAFGDGQRLVHPGPPGSRYHRFPVRNAGPDGVVHEGPGIALYSREHFAGGAIQPGHTWHFQGYYRDPQGPCGTGFNLSNALTVEFLP